MHLNPLLGTEETAEGKKTYLDVYNPTCFVNKYYVTLNEYQVVSDSLQPMDCSTPHFPVLHHLLELVKLMSIESVMPSNHLILCHPLLLLPSIFPSSRVFSSELAVCIRWPNYWSFSISHSNKYSGLISFRIDCLISLLSKGLSRVFFNTTVQKHQFSTQLSL